MTENRGKARPPASAAEPIEERGVLVDAAVTIVASGVGGAVGAAVTQAMNRPNDPPPPPPPSIELPPGVRRD